VEFSRNKYRIWQKGGITPQTGRHGVTTWKGNGPKGKGKGGPPPVPGGKRRVGGLPGVAAKP